LWSVTGRWLHLWARIFSIVFRMPRRQTRPPKWWTRISPAPTRKRKFPMWPTSAWWIPVRPTRITAMTRCSILPRPKRKSRSGCSTVPTSSPRWRI